MGFVDTAIVILVGFLVSLVIWAFIRIQMIRKKYKVARIVDNTAEAIVNHLYTAYPRFFHVGVGYYHHTAGNIELNVRDIPLLKKAFAKRGVSLGNAGPEAAVDGFHMELGYAGNTIGVKAYRNIN